MAKTNKKTTPEVDSINQLIEEAELLGSLSAAAAELFQYLLDDQEIDAACVVAELACTTETNMMGSARVWREILKQTQALLEDEEEEEDDDDDDGEDDDKN